MLEPVKVAVCELSWRHLVVECVQNLESWCQMSAEASLRPTYPPEKGLLSMAGTGGALEETLLLFFEHACARLVYASAFWSAAHYFL